MANVQINQLPAATLPLDGTELIPADQGIQTVQVTLEDVKNYINETPVLPYQVYTALLTQSGTSAPTAIELQNTIGAITFGYQSSGVYTVNSSALFTASKTWTNPTIKDNVNLPLSMYRNTDSLLFLIDANGDGGLLETSIEIRVYP